MIVRAHGVTFLFAPLLGMSIALTALDQPQGLIAALGLTVAHLLVPRPERSLR